MNIIENILSITCACFTSLIFMVYYAILHSLKINWGWSNSITIRKLVLHTSVLYSSPSNAFGFLTPTRNDPLAQN